MIEIQDFHNVLLNQTLYLFDKKDIANILNNSIIFDKFIKYKEFYYQLKVIFIKNSLNQNR